MFGTDPPDYSQPPLRLTTIGPGTSAGIFARPRPNTPEPLMPLVSATGWSGRQFQVRPFKIGAVFPAIAGVYIWCWQRTNGNWFALYVGQAEDLNDRLTKRLRQHQCYLRAIELGATHIAAMHAGEKTLRLQIETDLRWSLDPPLNRQ